VSRDAAKAAKAIAESALKKAGAKKVKGTWNMTPAVRKLAKAKK
jgi:hypothetical protein